MSASVTSTPSAADRTLPHNLEAERSILGAILAAHGRALDTVADLVRPEMFFRDAHRRIYRAMLRLHTRNEPIDFITLKEELDHSHDLAEVGGPAYIASVADGVPASTNVQFYARIVREKAAQREVIYAANRLLTKAYDQEGDAAELLDFAERTLLDVSLQVVPGDLVSAEQMVHDIYPVLEAVSAARRPTTGLETGFCELDRYTRGLQPGNLVILGGRPSQGKTTLAMQLALHVARSQPVAFFSVEMSQQEQSFRILSTLGNLDGHQLQCGQLPMHDYARLTDALTDFSQRQFWLDESAKISALQIRSRARRLKARVGLGLIVVDYLQLLSHPKADSREEAVASTGRMLKQVGRELQVPVIALCQLNRAVEHRTDKRPNLADLRESGSLEQDADLVLLIYRPPAKDDGVVKTIPPTELIIAKQRNGPTTSIELRFRGEVYRFEDLEAHP